MRCKSLLAKEVPCGALAIGPRTALVVALNLPASFCVIVAALSKGPAIFFTDPTTPLATLPKAS